MHEIDPTLLDDDTVRAALATRDVGTLYRLLGRLGVTQRQIAQLTDQSQSEVCEILKGRKVRDVWVLERITDGLGIPRARMGLSYGERRALGRHREQNPLGPRHHLQRGRLHPPSRHRTTRDGDHPKHPHRRVPTHRMEQPQTSPPPLLTHHQPMRRPHHQAGQNGQKSNMTEPCSFAGFRLSPDVITLAVRWYLCYGLSYRDVEELLAERGIAVDHVSIFRWVQRFTPLLAKAEGPCRHRVGDRWWVDETYVEVSGRWRTATGQSTSSGRSSTYMYSRVEMVVRLGVSSPGRWPP